MPASLELSKRDPWIFLGKDWVLSMRCEVSPWRLMLAHRRPDGNLAAQPRSLIVTAALHIQEYIDGPIPLLGSDHLPEEHLYSGLHGS